MGTTTDYKEKYLKSFFKWQNIYESACQRIKELEEKLKTVAKDIKWIEEQADTSCQYDYDAEVILKNIVSTCQETLKKIKE